jgi:hypothetical protein
MFSVDLVAAPSSATALTTTLLLARLVRTLQHLHLVNIYTNAPQLVPHSSGVTFFTPPTSPTTSSTAPPSKPTRAQPTPSPCLTAMPASSARTALPVTQYVLAATSLLITSTTLSCTPTTPRRGSSTRSTTPRPCARRPAPPLLPARLLRLPALLRRLPRPRLLPARVRRLRLSPRLCRTPATRALWSTRSSTSTFKRA